MDHPSLIVAIALLVTSSTASAKGSSSSGNTAPGTGAKPTSTHVKGYVKKDGTYVAPHDKSMPDEKFQNNWTTKGNENPRTGADGTRVTEPKK